MQHAVLVSVGAILFAIAIVLIARRGNLSMRYTLGWLFVATVIGIGALFSGLIDPIASALGIAPGTLVIVSATVALLAITVQLSITVSGLIELVRTLAEAHALLEERVRREHGRADTDIGADPTPGT